MSQNALALNHSASATKWTVVSGPMKGSVRLMNAASFIVGRSPDCGFVVINDPKCSRQHAQIDTNGFSTEVQSLNDKNLVMVNGKGVERAQLNDGDIVTFGETEVQFNQTSGQLSIVRPGHPAYAPAPTQGGYPAPSSHPAPRAAPGLRAAAVPERNRATTRASIYMEASPCSSGG